ncbi:putative alpha-L-fucosidase [Favolaschia claudopus]|uniref:alpha-L-fucosidase n=1 Tax=Favolaschia claudopus TaxID=2862362 RepID=A0AAW0CZX8_9AGAR
MYSLIFHWGLYSVPAYGGEWYEKQLLTPPSRKGNADDLSTRTQKHHREVYKNAPYSDFQRCFHPEKWVPSAWMTIATELDAEYVLLTSKHHDGYCLWPTATTDYHTHRDVVGDFKSAALQAGRKFGLYYSWWEFRHEVNKGTPDGEAYLKRMVAQVKELCDLYEPDIWWFDGDRNFRTKHAVHAINSAMAYIVERTPGVQINDRTGGTPELEAEKKRSQDYMPPYSTFRVYGDRAMPEVAPSVPWEHIGTVATSWGRDKTHTVHDYKTGRELWQIEQKVEGMGGRVCWNFGPDAEGELDEMEVAALRAAAELRRKAKAKESSNG